MFCTRLKEFLSERGIDFVERDVSGDEQALQELTLLGFMTTPVTQIGDEVVVGFDRKRLEALLG
jgi:glutaredoxin 3